MTKIYVYPSDRFGCGMFRLGWPAQYLQAAGRNDINLAYPDERWEIGAGLNALNEVVKAIVPKDARTIVIQRTTHAHLLGCIPFWKQEGVKVVVDVDDDLTCIHPSNPAFAGLKPGNVTLHSWQNLLKACQLADVVTCSTPALAARFPGNTVVLENYLPDHYYGLDRVDHAEVMWPASLGSHPDDASDLGGVIGRLAMDGAAVRMLGADAGAETYRRTLSMSVPPAMTPFVDIEDWPTLVAGVGVGVAPLSDTKFNQAKSWLKILEMSACGVPWVASDRLEYRNFLATGGEGGLLAANRKQWYRHLSALVRDQVYRKELSEAGRAAAENFRIRDHAERWYEVWD